MEIESRLLPCGLHVVGSPPSAQEAVATLVSISEIDRPENEPPTAGMPGILARAVGRKIEEIYANNNKVGFSLCICAFCRDLDISRYPAGGPQAGILCLERAAVHGSVDSAGVHIQQPDRTASEIWTLSRCFLQF